MGQCVKEIALGGILYMSESQNGESEAKNKRRGFEGGDKEKASRQKTESEKRI